MRFAKVSRAQEWAVFQDKTDAHFLGFVRQSKADGNFYARRNAGDRKWLGPFGAKDDAASRLLEE